ncbi:MAG: hypothetical protein RIQ60_3399 [Pseudomonadota bacterium]|jgi:NCS2 family nucleobase:cation symporter-2
MATPPPLHPVDRNLHLSVLTVLGLQHVLVMYAGAVAVPLIVGRVLHLSAEQVAMLISADLFCCGLATIVQSWGVAGIFGIRLPVMMGVTFAAVGPMVAIAQNTPGVEGARAIFGAVIGAGVVSVLIAPLVSRMLRYFPPVVTGTIILVIGVSLMRVGVAWAMDGQPTQAQQVDVPKLYAMMDKARADAAALAASDPAAVPNVTAPKLPGPLPMTDNPGYARLQGLGLAALVLGSILLITRLAHGFVANIAVLLGIVFGCLMAAALGVMHFDKVAKAPWFDVVTPFAFGMPTFDPFMVLTMVLVMVVVMIESTGMFLALSDITGKPLTQGMLANGLRADGLGTLIGGIFNTFPYTSFSQNVGLVGVTGVRSRYVCVTGGVIMVFLGLLPKLSALVESVPQVVLGGAGLVMFGMVAATGIRILSSIDFRTRRHDLYIVAVTVGFGVLPLVAPRWSQHMDKAIRPLMDSGILLASISAVVLNLWFNGAGAGSRPTSAGRAQEGHA